MSALENLKNAINNAKESCKEFSKTNPVSIPSEKLGETFTATEAVLAFEYLLQSVEVSVENSREIAKHIASNEISNATTAITNLSTALSDAFAPGEYLSFINLLDANIVHFRPFTMLSMEKMDSKRFKDVSNMEKTLQEMNTHVADVKIIFNKIFQQNKELEDILSKNNQRAIELDTDLPTAKTNSSQIQEWHNDVVGKSDEIKIAVENAQKIKNQLDVLLPTAQTNSSQIQEWHNDIKGKNNEIKTTVKDAQEIKNQLDVLFPTAQTNSSQIQEWHNDVKGKGAEIKATAENAQKIKDQLIVSETRAEDKNTELEKILDELKVSLENHDKNMASQIKKAKDMIVTAERALHLKTSEGLSAAFNAQARDLGVWWAKAGWLIFGAATSIIAAFLGWDTINALSSITSEWSPVWYIAFLRLSFIGIFLGLSTFAFKQYSKNKLLEYDYAFKSALVGSYPGISRQINDESTRKEYVEKLILEILRDPQRTRSGLVHKIKAPAATNPASEG